MILRWIHRLSIRPFCGKREKVEAKKKKKKISTPLAPLEGLIFRLVETWKTWRHLPTFFYNIYIYIYLARAKSEAPIYKFII